MRHQRFKLLYDGDCPFCRREIEWLRRLDRGGCLAFEDIAAVDFDPSLYGRTLDDLMGAMHGVLPDGRLTTGVEIFRQAYAAVGLGWLVAPTGWPILRPMFDALYRLFARNRVALGRSFGRKCDMQRCSIHLTPKR
jgi:predicted DCC family thiol-disulfide oxidoreductase YuxK